jgi:hypothetical protein
MADGQAMNLNDLDRPLGRVRAPGAHLRVPYPRGPARGGLGLAGCGTGRRGGLVYLYLRLAVVLANRAARPSARPSS